MCFQEKVPRFLSEERTLSSARTRLLGLILTPWALASPSKLCLLHLFKRWANNRLPRRGKVASLKKKSRLPRRQGLLLSLLLLQLLLCFARWPRNLFLMKRCANGSNGMRSRVILTSSGRWVRYFITSWTAYLIRTYWSINVLFLLRFRVSIIIPTLSVITLFLFRQKHNVLYSF